MNRTRVRRRFLVPEGGQGRLVRPLLSGGLVLAVLVFVAFYLLAQAELGNELVRAHSLIRTTMEMLGPYLLLVLGAGYLSFALLVFWWSRHVAGPMLRLRRSLDALADGAAVPPIALRRGDSGTELAGAVNRIAGLLAQQREGRAALVSEAEELKSAAARGEVEPAEALRRLTSRLAGRAE